MPSISVRGERPVKAVGLLWLKVLPGGFLVLVAALVIGHRILADEPRTGRGRDVRTPGFASLQFTGA
jgi:hypothetical protein